MKKAQSSLEFILVSSFLLGIFAISIFIVNSHLRESREQFAIEAVDRLAKSIENEIKVAKSLNDGYKRKIVVPTKLENEDFEIKIIANRELVITMGGLEQVTFLPSGIRGTIGRGANLIEKRDGIVYLQGIDVLITDRFIFKKDKSSPAIAVFKGNGDIVIKGILAQETIYSPTTDDEFLIRNSKRDIVLAINLNTGNMYIKGNLFEYEYGFSASADDLMTFSSKDGIVMKIEENGNLYIAGGLIQNGNPI